MAYLVELSRAAETEVLEAFTWKGDRSLEQASRWYNGLMTALTSLEEHPRRCSLALENSFFPEELHQLLYGKGHDTYRILFTIRGVTVYVLHVRHAAQKPLTPPENEGAIEDL